MFLIPFLIFFGVLLFIIWFFLLLQSRKEHSQMIEKCFITHSHEDHAGGAHMLNTEFRIPIITSEKAIDLLKKVKKYPEYRQAAWGP